MRTLLLLALAGCASDAPDTSSTAAVDTADASGQDSADTAATDTADTDTGDTSVVDTADSGDTGPTALDPYSLADEVSSAEIEATITDLAAIGTRYTFTDGDEAARDYLVDRFTDLGLVAELDPFDVSGTEANNILVVVPGTVTPETVFVFSAHYDSTSDDAMNFAPGADDNASGVAAVLEAARLVAAHPLTSTAWFVLTAAEEQGSLGSAHLADAWVDDGVDVRGVIAPDMMGYWPLGEGDAFDILGDAGSEPLVEQMSGVADSLGVANKPWIHHDYCYGDDHTNYQEAGFPALSPMDCVEAHNVRSSGEDTPHYHRTTDTVDTLNLAFTTQVTAVTVVTFASWVQPLEP